MATRITIDEEKYRNVLHKGHFELELADRLMYFGFIFMIAAGTVLFAVRAFSASSSLPWLLMELIFLTALSAFAVIYAWKSFRTTYYFERISTGFPKASLIEQFERELTGRNIPFSRTEKGNVFVTYEKDKGKTFENTLIFDQGIILFNSRIQNKSIIIQGRGKMIRHILDQILQKNTIAGPR